MKPLAGGRVSGPMGPAGGTPEGGGSDPAPTFFRTVHRASGDLTPRSASPPPVAVAFAGQCETTASRGAEVQLETNPACRPSACRRRTCERHGPEHQPNEEHDD